MFPIEAFRRTVERFAVILRQFEIPFYITDGSISSALGEPRITQDIDLVASSEVIKYRLEDLVGAIRKSAFLCTEKMIRRGVLFVEY